MWDLIVSVPDHCLSYYFTRITHYLEKNSKRNEYEESELKVNSLTIALKTTDYVRTVH